MYILNSPHVVHETIDGETILLHLKTGNYYSFDGIGALIWRNVIEVGSIENLIKTKVLDPEQKQKTEDFIESLVGEDLLKKGPLGDASSNNVSDELSSLVKGAIDQFKAPVLKKYSDMQELLLLDPIHDVEVSEGWPEAKS